MSRRLAFLALAVVLVACQHKTPEQKLLKDVEPAISWASTLQFASDRWLLNRVPSTFLRDTIKGAEKSLQTAIKATGESNASPQLRETIRQQLQDVESAADYVNHAIESNDRAAVQRAIGRFAEAYRQLNAIKERIEP